MRTVLASLLAIAFALAPGGHGGATIRPPGARSGTLPSAPCASDLDGLHDVTNAGDDLEQVLVPGHPSGAALCRYASKATGRGPSVVLTASRTVAAPTADRLAAAMDSLSTHRPTGVYGCPMATAAPIIVAFAYRIGPDVRIWFQDSGCQSLDNGHLRAYSVVDPSQFSSVATAIEALLPRSR